MSRTKQIIAERNKIIAEARGKITERVHVKAKASRVLGEDERKWAVAVQVKDKKDCIIM